MSGTQHNNFLSMQKDWRESSTPRPDNLSAGRAFSALLSPFPDSVLFALFFRFSALAAPLRRSRSALVLAALSVAVAGAQPAGYWIIETVVGVSDGGDGGPATAAYLNFPRGVAVDGAGNLYFDSGNLIRKVDATGVISTVAGGGSSLGDGGPAVEAQLNAPEGVALDGAGNLYFADRDNHRIRKVDAAGVITTVAGDGRSGYSGDGGAAVAARLDTPFDVAADGAGNLYIATGNRIRKVDAAGVITTVAGAGRSGSGGDGGPAVAAQLDDPEGVAVDGAGNLYIADRDNHRIRKVDAAGVITTVAGSGRFGSAGGDGGAAVAARLWEPSGVAVDGAGNLYIADRRNDRIRKVDAAGVITTVAGDGTEGFGGDGGPATAAQLDGPRGVALDGAGNLYIADTGNHRIRKVDAAGAISTVAGRELGDGGAATGARLRSPAGVAVDGAGNLYIADPGNGRIRKVDAAGVISTVAQLRDPEGVAVDGAGNLYIADTDSDRIRKVDAAGVISRVAGTWRPFGSIGDGGAATAARLDRPEGVAVDGAGNLYIADTFNHRIRKVDAAGVITTVAGSGEGGFGYGGFGGDGGPAVDAQLSRPTGVAVDGAGNLYIADTYNYRIRKVDAAGVITTVAGTGRGGYGGDGGPAVAARLTWPRDVALDGAGNLYIADYWNHRIRKVDAAGVISTVAGDGTEDGSGRGVYGGDGGPATAAQLSGPEGVALDGDGNLYIADTGNDLIRRLTPAPPPSISAGGVGLATQTPLVSRISPNALISVFGQGFAGTRTLKPVIDADGGIAVNLAATCLQIGGKRAPLFVVTPGQINAQVPHDLAPGAAALTVTRGCGTANEQRSAAASATVAAVSPAFFNFVSNLDGRNPLVALHGDGPALIGAPGLGAAFTPAEPGEVVTLYGTGFGPTEPAIAAGRIPGAAARLTNAVAFAVGGIAVPAQDVLYAGASPCCAGLYQFTLRLPADVPDGNADVVATVNGVPTPSGPFLTVRVAGGGGTTTDDHGDTPAEATALSPGSPAQGRIETGSDVDYFRLQTTAESDVEIYTSGSLNTTGSLHDSANNRIVENDDGGTGSNFRIARRLSAGVYYIAVSSSGSRTGSYTLHARTTTDDHGDTPAAATALSPGSPAQGRIETGSDVDYFRLRTTAASNVVIYTSGSLDTTGSLHDSANNRIVANDDGGTGRNFRIERRLSAGVYYIAVSSSGSRTGSYTLTATIETGGGGTPDDHGDTPAAATALSPGSPAQGRIETGSDVDYFRLRTTAESDVEIYTSGSLDTTGSLHDSANNRIVANDDGGTGSNFRIARRLSAGVYYIAVRSSGSRTGSYTLHARTTTDDHGDTPAAATALSPGSPAQGRIETGSDVDYFRLRTTAASNVEIYTSGSLDTTGSLHDSANNRIVANDDGGTGRNFRIERRLSAGVYYIAVRSSGSRTGSYTLHARTTTDDHGDTPAAATALSPGSPAQGRIETGSDVDYFRLRTTAASNVEIYTSGSLDTTGSLHDSANNRIVANDDSGAGRNFRIARRLSAGVYYIAVRSSGSRTGSYTLHARVTAAPPPDVYTPLASWTVADGRVTLAGLTVVRCITLGSGTINGVSYTAHTSKWQRRGNENSPWTDIARTERRGQLCAYTTTQPGQYRGVADLTIDGERGMYSSANFFTKE